MKDTSYIAGTAPIDFSYMNGIDEMCMFKIEMGVPYLFVKKISTEEAKKLREDSEKWIKENISKEELAEYLGKAVKAGGFFKVKNMLTVD